MSKKDVIERYRKNKAPIAQNILNAFEKSSFKSIADIEKISGRESVRPILSGLTQRPRIDSLRKIAKALNVSLSYLVEGGEHE